MTLFTAIEQSHRAMVMETGWIEERAVVGQKHFMPHEVPLVFVIPKKTARD